MLSVLWWMIAMFQATWNKSVLIASHHEITVVWDCHFTVRISFPGLILWCCQRWIVCVNLYLRSFNTGGDSVSHGERQLVNHIYSCKKDPAVQMHCITQSKQIHNRGHLLGGGQILIWHQKVIPHL